MNIRFPGCAIELFPQLLVYSIGMGCRRLNCFFLLFFLWTITPAQQLRADILQYVDDAGGRHFVDAPDKVPAQYRGQLQNQAELPKLGKISSRKLPDVPVYVPATRSRPILLVTETCPYCRMTEALLLKERVKYTRYDIEKENQGRELYNQLGGGGVPIFKAGKKIVRGYIPGEIMAAIGRK